MNTHNDYMINTQGHLVPTSKVKPEDKIENDLVNGLFHTAQILHREIKSFKEDAFQEVDDFIALLEQHYTIEKGGKKGNVTLMSYDGLKKVQVSVADHIQFGPQLQMAKQLIDECINNWSNGSNDNIRALIEHAFRVDKNNQINTANVLGLRRLDIRDEKWLKAMEAISESVRIISSKRYMRFYTRPHSESDWQNVSLDIARI
jgi:hypothetical protein